MKYLAKIPWFCDSELWVGKQHKCTSIAPCPGQPACHDTGYAVRVHYSLHVAPRALCLQMAQQWRDRKTSPGDLAMALSYAAEIPL